MRLWAPALVLSLWVPNGAAAQEPPERAASAVETTEGEARGRVVLRVPLTVERPPGAVHGQGGGPLPAMIAFLAAAVGGVGATTFGILSWSEHARLHDTCPCYEDEVSTLRAYTIIADVSLLVLAAGAIVGTLVMLTE